MLNDVDQDTAGPGNPLIDPLIDGVTRAWDLLVQQLDELLGWSPPTAPPRGARPPSALSDSDLRAALRAAAERLADRAGVAAGPAQEASAPVGREPRWRFNLPAAVAEHVAAMLSEASDAFGLAVVGLDDHAAPASLVVVGRLAEILARSRWLLEPSDPGQRRERGYALTVEAIARLRSAAEHADEARGDDAAGLVGEIADRAATMEARLAELRQDDGLRPVRVPKRRKLLEAYLPGTDLELFAILSAAGSDPGPTPSALFYTEAGNGDPLRGFQRLHVTRAYWLAQAITLYAGLCEAAGPVLGRDDWAEAAITARARFLPLAQEAARRYQQRIGRGLHPGL
jgi:hypothetical protein